MTGEAAESGHTNAPRPQTGPGGKASFADIYNQATPRAYFSALRPLSYATPERAQPIVRRCVETLRRQRQLETVTVLDLCAGYGVNSALLKHDLSLEELYQRFTAPQVHLPPAKSIAADADWFRESRRNDLPVRVIAQDVAAKALDYAHRVGLADETLPLNLEEKELEEGQADLLRDVDLIVVTGGISYIGKRTFSRVLGACRRSPWALYFPLRHSDSQSIDSLFEQAGYKVEVSRRAVAHRRFESPQEQRRIRSRILARSEPRMTPPSWTYLEAMLKLALPKEDCRLLSFESMIDRH
ncbi:MAG: hypothetical protein RIC87_21705 [Kiloniellales bacterium]